VFLFPTGAVAQVPNDPNALQWGYELLNVPDAWGVTQGSSDVVVAIVDNGFDTYHPDLYANVWQNEDEIDGNGIDDDNNGYVDDRYGWDFHDPRRDEPGYASGAVPLGDNDPRPDVLALERLDTPANRHFHHGTVVAGIIGAVGDNKLDGVGINWRVKLMNLKVTDANSGQGQMSALAEAIRYAVDNGADIINFSVVGGDNLELRHALDYAYDRGVALVAASGNNMQDLDLNPNYPVCADAGANIERVIGVSAIRETRQSSGFSNVGLGCVDITAPGVDVSSTMRFAPSYGLADQYGGGWQGTSFGVPFVSGAMALIKSIHSSWKAPDLYDIIFSTVSRTPPEDPEEYARFFGAGLIDIGAAIKEAAARKALLGPQVQTITLQSDQAAIELLANGNYAQTLPVESMNIQPGITVESLPSFIDRVSIARRANVQGNATEEIVLLGSLGGQPALIILDSEGNLIRAVIIQQHQTGLAVFDSNGDGTDEIYTYPTIGSGEVIQWLNGRRVVSWALPEGQWQFVVTYEDESHVVY